MEKKFAFDAVILDTTALFADLLMRSVASRILAEGLARFGRELVVSQVVLEEATRHFSDKRANAISKIGDAFIELQRLGEDHLKVPSFFWQPYPLARPDAWPIEPTILPYPNVSHSDLVRRDLGREKPFTETGKGYRDALIWLSIAERYRGEQKRLALITNNSKDFVEHGRLHKDLERDLWRPPSRTMPTVEVFSSLDQFNEKHIIPLLPDLPRMRANLERGRFDRFNPRNWVEQNLTALVPLRALYGVLFEEGDASWQVRHFSIDRIVAVRVLDVKGIKEKLFRIRVEVGTRVSYFIRDDRVMYYPKIDNGVETWPVEGRDFLASRAESDEPLTIVLDILYDDKKAAVIAANTSELRAAAGTKSLGSSDQIGYLPALGDDAIIESPEAEG